MAQGTRWRSGVYGVGAVAAALVVGLLGLDAAGLGVRSDAWGARAPTTARRILVRSLATATVGAANPELVYPPFLSLRQHV